MPASVIVGLQWGDEGKGKTTDFLAEQVAMVVRYQGGDNAGHTVVKGDEVLKLHLVPSGVLYPHITSVIGSGVVVNPETLIGELDMLTSRGIDVSRVRVSRSAHVIMPYHVALDRGNEARLDGAKVGTTGRGIGPTYGDRAWRVGLRMEDLLDPDVLRMRLARLLPDKNLLLGSMGVEGFDVDRLVELAAGWGERLSEHLDDTTWLVQSALARGEHVLLEGAQGTLLDLDHGSYPFVTSSNAVAGGATTGGGIGPLQVDEVMGVMKAYATRVGSGPFPTELLDEVGEGIRERGREVGTTTGRPRRVGWFDAVPIRYAVAVNSVSSIMLNKLDILSGLASIPLCVAYDVDGVRVDRWPSSASVLARATPVYESFEGWSEPIHQVRTLADLPDAARRYVSAIEELAGVPIVLVSVGPERTQTIERAWRPMRRRPAAAIVAAPATAVPLA
jgi:adenylosuccinate synthase